MRKNTLSMREDLNQLLNSKIFVTFQEPSRVPIVAQSPHNHQQNEDLENFKSNRAKLMTQADYFLQERHKFMQEQLSSASRSSRSGSRSKSNERAKSKVLYAQKQVISRDLSMTK